MYTHQDACPIMARTQPANTSDHNAQQKYPQMWYHPVMHKVDTGVYA